MQSTDIEMVQYNKFKDESIVPEEPIMDVHEATGLEIDWSVIRKAFRYISIFLLVILLIILAFGLPLIPSIWLAYDPIVNKIEYNHLMDNHINSNYVILEQVRIKKSDGSNAIGLLYSNTKTCRYYSSGTNGIINNFGMDDCGCNITSHDNYTIGKYSIVVDCYSNIPFEMIASHEYGINMIQIDYAFINEVNTRYYVYGKYAKNTLKIIEMHTNRRTLMLSIDDHYDDFSDEIFPAVIIYMLSLLLCILTLLFVVIYIRVNTDWLD